MVFACLSGLAGARIVGRQFFAVFLELNNFWKGSKKTWWPSQHQNSGACELYNLCWLLFLSADTDPCADTSLCADPAQCRPVRRTGADWGHTCGTQKADPCQPNPCAHEGTCESSDNGYTCNCPDDFPGPNCEGAYFFLISRVGIESLNLFKMLLSKARNMEVSLKPYIITYPAPVQEVEIWEFECSWLLFSRCWSMCVEPLWKQWSLSEWSGGWKFQVCGCFFTLFTVGSSEGEKWTSWICEPLLSGRRKNWG